MLIVLAAGLPAVLSPAGAHAVVIARSVAGFEGGPALASDGRVVVGEVSGRGGRRIVAIDPVTHAITQLAAFAAPVDPAIFNELSITGTGGIVTASLRTWHDITEPDPPEGATPYELAHRTMTLLPVPALIGTCSSLIAAGGDSFVAATDEDCAGNSTLNIHNPNGTIVIHVQTGPADRFFAPSVLDVRASGALVAWTEAHLASVGAQASKTAIVARAATGEVLLRVPDLRLSAGIKLGSDGTLVLNDLFAPSCELHVAMPQAPQPRTVQTGAKLCPAPPGDGVQVAGGRIVYRTFVNYAVTDLQGVAHALPGVTATSAIRDVAFDGRTVYVVSSDCDADRLLAVDASTPANTRPRDALPTCRVRRSGRARLRVTRDRRVRIGLRCRAGCRGRLRLVQQRSGQRQRVVAETDYAAARNTTTIVRPRIAAYARALAGCSGGLRIDALLYAHGSYTSRGLGSYRISSRSRCRRSGGPTFTPSARPPRP